jgi:four helix bundle protein
MAGEEVDCGSWMVNGKEGMAELARSFRELRVYQMARISAKRVFETTRSFPREEIYSLTDQIRRSSRSTKNQIPEAWAKRQYPAAFASKLADALGEAMETQGWLDDALDCGYISERQHVELNADYQSIGAMLNTMIRGAEDFVPLAYRDAKPRKR